MRLLRAIPGALLWILGSVSGLLGAILCLTVIGLPLGIPLLKGARRMFSNSVKLLLPQRIAHPAKAAKKETLKKAKAAKKGSVKKGKAAKDTVSSVAPDGKKVRKKARKLAKAA